MREEPPSSYLASKTVVHSFVLRENWRDDRKRPSITSHLSLRKAISVPELEIDIFSTESSKLERPMALVVPGQLLVEALARAKGLDPDAPRGLRKVTQTDTGPR